MPAYNTMISSRLLGGDTLAIGALAAGMPLWKCVSKRFLTTVENLALGQHLAETHSGFRAYSRRLLETIPFLLNTYDFVFDTEVIAQTVTFKFRIGEIAVPPAISQKPHRLTSDAASSTASAPCASRPLHLAPHTPAPLPPVRGPTERRDIPALRGRGLPHRSGRALSGAQDQQARPPGPATLTESCLFFCH